MSKLIGSVSVLLSVSLMVGCSDSGSDYAYVYEPGATPPVVITTLSGTAIDGVIEGATVCIDVNENNACDATEPTATTDVFGKFNLNSSGVTGTLLLTGGTDMGTGLPFSGSLKAPAGSTVVTPLTSAVQALVETGASAADAEKTIKTALGIPAAVDVTSYDPFEEISGDDAVNAQIVLAAQAELQTIVHSVSATVAGADSTTTIADTMDSAMATIAKGLEAAVIIAGDDAPVELTSELVVTATKAVANTVYADKPEAMVATKAVAESAAVEAVAVAADTKAAVEAAVVTDSDAVELAFNTGMIVTNDALEKSVEKKTTDAAIDTAGLTAAELKIISDAQVAQEKAEADIAAKELLEAQAAADIIAAQKALDEANEAEKQEKIVELARAAEAAAQAAAETAKAEALAAQAAKDAAAAEAALASAAAEAAVKEAAADLAATQAAAELALAEELEAAANQAAIDAANAADAEAAAKAAQDAADAAAKDIAAAKAEAERLAKIEEAAAKTVAEAAAKAADTAAAAAEAEAIAAAEAAAEAEAIAKACTDMGGEMVDDECKMPIDPNPLPTGGFSF